MEYFDCQGGAKGRVRLSVLFDIGARTEVPDRRSMPQQTVHLLLSLLYRRGSQIWPSALISPCRSGFVTCRGEAVLVMSLPGLLLCSRSVTRRRAKHTGSFLQHPSDRARSPRPRPRRGGPPPDACTYGPLAGGGRHGALPVSPVRSSASPQWMAGDSRRSWAEPAHRVATVDGIGVDDERSNEKVALPQARLTSCEVIGTHRRTLQFPSTWTTCLPPSLTDIRRRDAQTPRLFPVVGNCHRPDWSLVCLG